MSEPLTVVLAELESAREREMQSFIMNKQKRKKEEEIGKKNKLITMYNNNSFAHKI